MSIKNFESPRIKESIEPTPPSSEAYTALMNFLGEDKNQLLPDKYHDPVDYMIANLTPLDSTELNSNDKGDLRKYLPFYLITITSLNIVKPEESKLVSLVVNTYMEDKEFWQVRSEKLLKKGIYDKKWKLNQLQKFYRKRNLPNPKSL